MCKMIYNIYYLFRKRFSKIFSYVHALLLMNKKSQLAIRENNQRDLIIGEYMNLLQKVLVYFLETEFFQDLEEL